MIPTYFPESLQLDPTGPPRHILVSKVSVQCFSGSRGVVGWCEGGDPPVNFKLPVNGWLGPCATSNIARVGKLLDFYAVTRFPLASSTTTTSYSERNPPNWVGSSCQLWHVMSLCARPLSAASKASSSLSPLIVPKFTQRTYATQTGGAPRFQVFNRRAKWLQKERAAANSEAGREADYLKDEVAIRLSERLLVSGPTRHKTWISLANKTSGYQTTIPKGS